MNYVIYQILNVLNRKLVTLKLDKENDLLIYIYH